MDLDLETKNEILRALGANEEDLAVLTAYTANAFICKHDIDNLSDSNYLELWNPFFISATENGTANAINLHLVRPDLKIDFENPEGIEIELFCSVAGKIPIITAKSTADFEKLVTNIVNRGIRNPFIKNLGASFVFGKINRFIILSYKPYSNVLASDAGLDETLWIEKSLVIRKHHECVHYYTKRYYGSTRNNLHDELIADFYGLWAAFGTYEADLFKKFLAQGRLRIYVQDLPPSAAAIIEKLAYAVADQLEVWTKSESFRQMNEKQRINFLCEKELLEYMKQI